jgi:hypothetical protein
MTILKISMIQMEEEYSDSQLEQEDINDGTVLTPSTDMTAMTNSIQQVFSTWDIIDQDPCDLSILK